MTEMSTLGRFMCAIDNEGIVGHTYSLSGECTDALHLESMKTIYLIKDLAKLSGHTVHTVKYYLKLKLIKEIGRSPETNFRYFDDLVLERLKKIRALRKENKPLAEIKEILESDVVL